MLTDGEPAEDDDDDDEEDEEGGGEDGDGDCAEIAGSL